MEDRVKGDNWFPRTQNRKQVSLSTAREERDGSEREGADVSIPNRQAPVKNV